MAHGHSHGRDSSSGGGWRHDEVAYDGYDDESHSPDFGGHSGHGGHSVHGEPAGHDGHSGHGHGHGHNHADEREVAEYIDGEEELELLEGILENIPTEFHQARRSGPATRLL